MSTGTNVKVVTTINVSFDRSIEDGDDLDQLLEHPCVNLLFRGGRELEELNQKNHDFSLRDLQKSMDAPGNYFIFTCPCGAPSCVGIYNPVSVSHEPDFVIWDIIEPTEMKVKIPRQELRDSLDTVIAEIRNHYDLIYSSEELFVVEDKSRIKATGSVGEIRIES